jgi:glycine cleavage system H protein
LSRYETDTSSNAPAVSIPITIPMSEGDAVLDFQRAKFKTKLPRGRLYTAGHMWLRSVQADLWQIGLTRFALRMLGEPVELEFETRIDQRVETGQVVGWLEGFKAVTDLYSPMTGVFAGANPALDDEIGALHVSPYDRGWLFSLAGEPAVECVSAEGYASFLDMTIDKMLGEQGEGAER